MEKFIELLDLYRRENKTEELFGEPGTLVPLTGKDFIMINRVMIISKEYGFIKWLVDNDKIDRVEVWSTGMTKPTYGYTTEPYTTCKSIKLENTILMVLSIQDEPIEFLISILK